MNITWDINLNQLSVSLFLKNYPQRQPLLMYWCSFLYGSFEHQESKNEKALERSKRKKTWFSCMFLYQWEKLYNEKNLLKIPFKILHQKMALRFNYLISSLSINRPLRIFPSKTTGPSSRALSYMLSFGTLLRTVN